MEAKRMLAFTAVELKDVTEALEDVLFAALMHYLDTDTRGLPDDRDRANAATVRGLLEDLKKLEQEL